MTTTSPAQTRAELGDEDNQRMRRLAEEVQGRLREMSLIAARNLDLTLPVGATATFTPHSQDEEADADQTVEVVIIALPDGTFGCYQDPPGICVYPC